MRGLVTPIILLLALLISATSLLAATWYVKPDGSGDAPTIDAAADSAAPGDTILLANGTFTGDGNRDIRLYYGPLIVMSESLNPDLCVVDCGGTASEYHQGFDIRFAGEPPVIIAGVTIRGAYSTASGAIYVGTDGGLPGRAAIVGCVLTGNTSVWGGPAVYVLDGCFASLVNTRVTGNSANSGTIYLSANSALAITGGVFSDNSAEATGGAISLYSAALIASSCTFQGNVAGSYGGAIYGTSSSALSLTGCSFIGNSASSGGGAIYSAGGEVILDGCSSMHNSSSYGASLDCAGEATALVTSCSFVADSSGSAALVFGPDASTTISRTVIAFAKQATAVYCTPGGSTPTVTCSDIFGNQYGDWTGCIEGLAGTEGNISEDPLFCDLAGGSVDVEDCSPCLAAHNSCSLNIGAGSSDCACGEATEPTTWGAIKAMYK